MSCSCFVSSVIVNKLINKKNLLHKSALCDEVRDDELEIIISHPTNMSGNIILLKQP